MRGRPLILPALMLAFFAIAASFPMQVMLLHEHTVAEWPATLYKLTWLNWMVMFGAVFCGVLIYQASPMVTQTVPLMIVLVGLNNLFVGYYATDYSMATTSLGTLAFAALNLPLLSREVRELIRHPERRWWRSAARLRIPLPVYLDGPAWLKLDAETWDLSETGAFIPMPRSDLHVGGRVRLNLKLGVDRQLKLEAKVVRHSDAKGTYPAGVGVQFMNMDHEQRRELRRYLEAQLEA